LVSGLVLGGSAAVVLAVFAHPLLSLIGAEYADASTNALRVLTVGLIPFAVWQSYNARCRAAGLVREGIVAGLALAGGICLASVWAAPRGSTALAIAWVTSSALGAVWAAWRLSRREQVG
jgi:O-antigen/teichoic acid export membrane protein